MYGRLDQAKLFTVTQALSELKQGNLSVTSCFNRLSALWNELEAAEERLEGPEDTLQQYRKIKEREKTMRFLLILNESFSAFRSQILAMDPPPTLGRIYQLAVQEEHHWMAATEHARVGEGMSLAVLPSGEATSSRTSTDLERKIVAMAMARRTRGGNPKSLRSDGSNPRYRMDG